MAPVHNTEDRPALRRDKEGDFMNLLIKLGEELAGENVPVALQKGRPPLRVQLVQTVKVLRVVPHQVLVVCGLGRDKSVAGAVFIKPQGTRDLLRLEAGEEPHCWLNEQLLDSGVADVPWVCGGPDPRPSTRSCRAETRVDKVVPLLVVEVG